MPVPANRSITQASRAAPAWLAVSHWLYWPEWQMPQKLASGRFRMPAVVWPVTGMRGSSSVTPVAPLVTLVPAVL